MGFGVNSLNRPLSACEWGMVLKSQILSWNLLWILSTPRNRVRVKVVGGGGCVGVKDSGFEPEDSGSVPYLL